MSHTCLSDLTNFLICRSSIFKPSTNLDLLASINILRFPWPVLLCIKVNKSTVVDDPRYATALSLSSLAAVLNFVEISEKNAK